MKLIFLLTGILIVTGSYKIIPSKAEPLLVRKCSDFTPTGKGNDIQWEKAAWNILTKLDTGDSSYESKFKILYSSAGIYLLFYGKDNKITTQFDQDFQDLYKGDVFEAFFHPDSVMPLYFEYEINQLNKELVLLVPHLENRVYGWLPWHYENKRIIKKFVDLVNGKMEPGSVLSSWTAEIFFPFEIFQPLGNTPPTSGTIWNANFYRLDYDSGTMIKWAWSPVEKSFHEFDKFGQIRFE